MSTPITTAPPSRAPLVLDARVLLEGISWATYESLLEDRGERRWPRLTFDRGWLEIVSPRTAHDEDNRTLAHVVLLVAEELNMELRNTGGFTYKSEVIEAGFEPDSGYYLEREPSVRGKREIEGSVDPPPDLVIEVDVTHSSSAKLPLLARVGVKEVWRVSGGRVLILRPSVDGSFEVVDESEVFPGLTGLTNAVLNRFLVSSQTSLWTEWVRSVRRWVGDQATTQST